MITTTINSGFANNSYLHVKKDCPLHEFKPLKSEPEFAVNVNGESLIGKLTGRTNNPVEWQLVVEFNNGVTDIFYIPYGTTKGLWFAGNKKHIAYAKAINNKLTQLLSDNMLNFGKD